MTLLSHGPGSNLLEHLRETAQAASSEKCRELFLCHDIGKATKRWQKYIRTLDNNKPSPHPHAGAGALLAAALLHNTGASPMEELAAMHCIAAHHSYLSALVVTVLNGAEEVSGDEQAKNFFLDRSEGVASLLPAVSDDVLKKSWDDFRELANSCSDLRAEFAERLAEISDRERLDAYLLAREWLGALCFTDRFSAQKQKKKLESIPEYCRTFAAKAFQPRPCKTLPTGKNRVYELRSSLQENFLKLVESGNPIFTFLDAPTGMGKTETMLRAAERIREKCGANRIIYAVPQVSIADQIFEDYFFNASSAQIWNYRRKQMALVFKESDNFGDRASLLFDAHPFAESYDITTFNQVLLSMLHPDRDRCIRQAGMRDSVIIMDEFHKLPMTILPLFFPAARAFAERCHCRFIFGSATPFQLLPYWSLEDAVHLEQQVTEPLYSAPEINLRREYHTLGTMDIDRLIAEIEARHSEFSRDNLLVVVNLVEKISWPLRRHFIGSYQPWQDLERQKGFPPDKRRFFVLDGLTPPVLRRDIVVQCRDAMKQHIPITLITTQMVEVGIDLDFDRALCDFQGLASVIQRGGRVGREGRANGKPCPVELFSLLTSDDKQSSFEVLNEVSEQNVQKIGPLKKSAEDMAYFRREEMRFFRQWQPNVVLRDSDLTKTLLELQRKVFRGEKFSPLWSRFFDICPDGHQQLGSTFEYAHFISEIGGESYGKEVIVVPSSEEMNELVALDEKISGNRSSFEEREHFRKFLADHRIVITQSLYEQLGISVSGWLKNPDPVEVSVMASLIF